jgi:hypothetical protein
MNHRFIVATVVFLLLLSQFPNANAAGPYDANGGVPRRQSAGAANEPLLISRSKARSCWAKQSLMVTRPTSTEPSTQAAP